jgi:hypothetical protein
MSGNIFAVRAPQRRHALLGSVLAAVVVAVVPLSTAWAAPAGGIFPMVLTDTSCQDVNSADATHTTDCNPDAPSWTQSDSNQPQQIVVADNVNAPDSVASSAQSQDASAVQAP